MSEHWKSTPKYYCKYCLTYVRDTKLERANHEATGKHQGAVRRALTNLHRTTNNEVRERERAKREIDRLNGVVSNNNNNSGTTHGTNAPGASGVGGARDKGERTRQAEQLAALGVALPQQFRGELAMPGEWSVTSTTVVEDKTQGEAEQGAARRARGVHKRERTQEQLEHEEAVKGLFKRPRRWGRDARGGLAEGSEDLDALLSGGLVVKKDEEGGDEVKQEDGSEVVAKDEDQAEEHDAKEEASFPAVKRDPEEEADSISAGIPAEEAKAAGISSVDGLDIKREEDSERPSEAADVPVVAFKKRKPKSIRQK